MPSKVRVVLIGSFSDEVAPLVVVPVQAVPWHQSIFQKILASLDILGYSVDFRGFGHHSIRIAIGVTEMYQKSD